MGTSRNVNPGGKSRILLMGSMNSLHSNMRMVLLRPF